MAVERARNAIDLGALVVAGGDLAVCERGFRLGEASAAYSEVRELNRSDGDPARLEVVLDDGRRLHGAGRGDAVAALARLATPHLVARARATIVENGYAAFGPDLRITGSGLFLPKKSRPIAAAEIAGYRVYHGALLVDTDRERPRLVAQLPIARMVNPDAALALVAELAPRRNLDQHPYAVPGSPWRPSARSHDPRHLSTRARLIVGLPACALLLLLVGAALLKVMATVR